MYLSSLKQANVQNKGTYQTKQIVAVTTAQRSTFTVTTT